MGRSVALGDHLPPLYREGELVGAYNDVWGVQLDMLDEAAFIVQRARWFDSTPDLDEAAALAALVDISPEEFHADLGEYRAWVHALTNARLQGGAVTRDAIRILVDTYVQGFQRSADIDLVGGITEWAREQNDERAALVENPARFRSARLPAAGGFEPLARLHVTNAGIDPAPWAVVLTGIAGGSEYSPFLANRTTGYAVVYRGEIGVGARLTIAPTAADPTVLRADLDGIDVSDRLLTYPDLVAGPDGPGVAATTNVTAPLARGDNDWWFLPLAHYDTPGLGRFLLALADDALRMGRFDETPYDHSLFAQRPEISAWLAWVEREPASVEVHLPAHTMRTDVGRTDAGVEARQRLETGLDLALDRTAAAGIATDVVLDRRAERQPGTDRLTAIFPRTHREIGPTGADLLADAGGVFGVTDYEEATFR